MWLETNAMTFLSEGTRIQGSMTFLSAATVHCVVEGDLIQQGVELLHVGKRGWIHGSVSSLGPVLVEGRIEGDLRSKSRVTIAPSGVVSGKIDAPAIEVSPGAQINGELQIRGAQNTQLIDSMS